MTTEGRKRGRPPRTSGHEPVTKELIGRVALEIAGAEGFPQLTMRRLAAEIGVTVRALYNVVADRQEVVDLAAARLMDLLPVHDFDTDDWRASLRRVYAEARAAYRAVPRATLISLDETVTPREVSVQRIIQPERMLAFLVAIGLSLDDALTVRGFFLTEVFGFVLLVDYRYDRSDEQIRQMMFHPVPGPWLAAHPEVEAPLSRGIAAGPARTADDLFEALVERAIRAVEGMLPG
ncbi:TetR/AcrR family transcriptional regulator [Nocardia sp. AG03]|uniref:TetR/AcrR family transcriptional regulator n=1 Tax=Nocardia sp. AG03 TaxID=3025312 RepID=UPI00241882A3|nr:TetR/AcrR family transcriptional regulator [Nocardia sp. AG03]